MCRSGNEKLAGGGTPAKRRCGCDGVTNERRRARRADEKLQKQAGGVVNVEAVQRPEPRKSGEPKTAAENFTRSDELLDAYTSAQEEANETGNNQYVEYTTPEGAVVKTTVRPSEHVATARRYQVQGYPERIGTKTPSTPEEVQAAIAAARAKAASTGRCASADWVDEDGTPHTLIVGTYDGVMEAKKAEALIDDTTEEVKVSESEFAEAKKEAGKAKAATKRQKAPEAQATPDGDGAAAPEAPAADVPAPIDEITVPKVPARATKDLKPLIEQLNRGSGVKSIKASAGNLAHVELAIVLGGKKQWFSRTMLAQRSDLTPEGATALAKSDVAAMLAENPNAPKEGLHAAADNDDYGVRIKLANNPATPLATQLKLARDEAHQVRQWLRNRPNLDDRILAALDEHEGKKADA